jgi:hypothetical protein
MDEEEYKLLELTASEQLALRKFLDSKAGRTCVSILYSRSPIGNSGNTIDEMALQGAKNMGWRACIEELLALVNERVSKQ